MKTKRTPILLALLLALAAAAVAQTDPPAPAAGVPPEWPTFRPPSRVFTAQFPGVPSYLQHTQDYGAYKTTAHRYKLEQSGRNVGYFEAFHAQLPPNDGDMPVNLILDAIIDTVLSRPGSKETVRAAVSSNGCAGKEFTALVDGSVHLQGRAFIADDQIVAALYAGPAAVSSHKQIASRFLNSLTISKPCAAAAPTPEPTPAPVKTGRIEGTPDAATGWRLIAPPQSGFSALMPGAAESEEELVQRKPYPLTVRSYLSAEGRNVYVAVECGDFPAETARIPSFDEIKMSLVFRGMEEEAKTMGAEVVLEGRAPFAGFPARQYRLTAADGGGRVLVVSTPRKVYAFLAFTDGPPQRALAERFFSSIKFEK